jgi:hypothetical protein
VSSIGSQGEERGSVTPGSFKPRFSSSCKKLKGPAARFSEVVFLIFLKWAPTLVGLNSKHLLRSTGKGCTPPPAFPPSHQYNCSSPPPPCFWWIALKFLYGYQANVIKQSDYFLLQSSNSFIESVLCERLSEGRKYTPKEGKSPPTPIFLYEGIP